MPPQIPPVRTLKDPKAGKISKRGAEALVAFYDVDGAGLALQASAFTQEELIETIIQHVRDEDARISQKGISQLWGIMHDILKINGLIARGVHHQVQHHEDGSTTSQQVSAERLVDRLEAQAPSEELDLRGTLVEPERITGGSTQPRAGESEAEDPGTTRQDELLRHGQGRGPLP